MLLRYSAIRQFLGGPNPGKSGLTLRFHALMAQSGKTLVEYEGFEAKGGGDFIEGC